MWFFRWMILAVVFVVLLYFGFQNAGLVVEGMRFGTMLLPEAPLLLILLAAFLLGLVVMFVIASVEYFRVLTRLRSAEKEKAQVSERLRVLQKIPLDDVDEALASRVEVTDGG